MAVLAFAAGILVIWTRSGVVGAEPIERPRIELIQGHVLERQDQSAQGRVRLTLAVRDASAGIARTHPVNVPIDAATPATETGTMSRTRARSKHTAPPTRPCLFGCAPVARFRGCADKGSVDGTHHK